jgi:hypothetical protein
MSVFLIKIILVISPIRLGRYSLNRCHFKIHTKQLVRQLMMIDSIRSG